MATAQQTLATGSERADQLLSGQTPWMTVSGVRGFYSRIDGSAQPYILTMPEGYDAAAKRQYRLDIFMHGRDDTVLEQQFMAKSTTGYTSKPFRAGADRFMLQPYGRYTNASRFAGEIDGLEAIESVAKAYPIDRNRIVMAGFSMGGASAWSYIVHYADRWVAAAPGAGFSETRGVPARRAGAAAAERRAADAVAHVRLDRLRGEHVQRAGRRLLGRHRRAEAGGRRHGRRDGGRRPHARARHRPEYRALLRAGGAAAGAGSARPARGRGRNPVPKEIRFTTWTLRYNRMFWLTVDAIEQHWQRARVNAAIEGDGDSRDDGRRHRDARRVRPRPGAVRCRRAGRR